MDLYPADVDDERYRAKWWAATIRTQGRVYFPGLKGRAAAIDPKDVPVVACRVLAQHEAHEKRIYEVTGPELLSIAQMIQILLKVLGSQSATFVSPDSSPRSGWGGSACQWG